MDPSKLNRHDDAANVLREVLDGLAEHAPGAFRIGEVQLPENFDTTLIDCLLDDIEYELRIAPDPLIDNDSDFEPDDIASVETEVRLESEVAERELLEVARNNVEQARRSPLAGAVIRIAGSASDAEPVKAYILDDDIGRRIITIGSEACVVIGNNEDEVEFDGTCITSMYERVCGKYRPAKPLLL